MSSLAAARADNFYYAPDFNPDVHKSLNKVGSASCCSLNPSALGQGCFLQLWPCSVHLSGCAVPALHRSAADVGLGCPVISIWACP